MLSDWLSDTSFASPWLLPLLLVIPWLLYWYITTNKKQAGSLKITTVNFLRHAGNWKTKTRHLPFALRCLGLITLIIALARPQQKFTEQQTQGEGIDIVLCFDITSYS